MKEYIKFIVIIFIITMMLFLTIPNYSDSASTYYQYVKSGISAFPESYQTKLKQLSSKYPKWKFQAYYTGIPWNELIEKERDESIYRNRVTATAPKSWKHCNFVDDGWACASDAAVKYYLDPRNFLNETQIFQFVETSYNEKVQTVSAIQESVKNTFLDTTITCKDFNGNTITKTYSQIIIDAAKKTNISAFYIKSKIIQEVGVTGSGSVTGKYPGHEGYYNFFNYGAYDEGDDIANGLVYAKNKGWDSPYKAIVGGAELIGKYYINQGQNTAYFNKWDVVGTKILKDGESQTVNSSDMFWHQYMTNIQDPNSQSYSNKKLYANSLQSEITFIIPVYENMPNSNPMPQDVPVTGITFNKNVFAIEVNEKGNVVANITPQNATNKNITWTVSDSEVLRLYNGDFRGLKEGVATITATTIDGEYSATCTVYVTQKHFVTDIQIEKDTYIVKEDEAVDVNYIYNPYDSVNAEFEWTSSDPEILRVYNNRFRGLKEGEAYIIVKTKDGSVETRSKVIVRSANKEYVEKINIEKSQYNIVVDEAVDVNFTYSPSNSVNAEFEWTSSNPEVLRVFENRFRGLQIGEAYIIAKTKDGTVEAKAKVVIKPQPVYGISTEKSMYVVKIDEKSNIVVNFDPINATNKNLYWTSSNPDVVRVYNGDIRGLKEGRSTITVVSEDGGKVATCEVVVQDPNKKYVETINLGMSEYRAYLDEAVDINYSYAPLDAINAEFEWISSDPEILRVYYNRFRALKEGTAEVIARTVDGTVEKRIRVTVYDPGEVKDIIFKQNGEAISQYKVYIDEAVDIDYNYAPVGATNAEFEWSSSNPEILRVYNNRFRGLKEGTAEVIVKTTDGDFEKRVKVTVLDPSKVHDIIFTQNGKTVSEYKVEVDEAVDIDYSYLSTSATNAEFEWLSSDPEILRVYNNRFRGLKKGTAYVIVRTIDGTFEEKIKVTVE